MNIVMLMTISDCVDLFNVVDSHRFDRCDDAFIYTHIDMYTSRAISLFSSKLFNTGSTFLSAFSRPSMMSTRP